MFNAKKVELLRHVRQSNLEENNYPKPSGTYVIEGEDVVTDLCIRMNNKADFSDHGSLVD